MNPVIARIAQEVVPPRYPTPQAGQPANFDAWQADQISRGTRAFVVLTAKAMVVVLMIATFLTTPAPAHELAAAMLWLTAIGAVAAVVAPRFITMGWGVEVRRHLEKFRRSGTVGGQS